MSNQKDLIANRYKVLQPLGTGASATTYLAIDVALDRHVAIKVLNPERECSEAELASLRQEARIAAQVSHPNIVKVYDAGVADEKSYLVMEWVDGSTLKTEIQSRRSMSISRALSLTEELLSGLESIHSQGIVHRDIKPQNILVTRDGTLKVTDFGVAGPSQDPGEACNGFTMGTAAYMAPEQAQGIEVTPAADIYAVGVILYEMLTGALPFTDDDPLTVIQRHMHDPVRRPKRLNPNIPGPIERVILTAMAKNPRARYRSAAEMRAALRSAYRQTEQRRVLPQPQYAVSPSMAQTATLARNQRVFWIAASAVLVSLMIAGSAALATREFSVQSDTVSEIPTVNLLQPRIQAAPVAEPEESELTESEADDDPAPNHWVARDDGLASEPFSIPDVTRSDESAMNEDPDSQNGQEQTHEHVAQQPALDDATETEVDEVEPDADESTEQTAEPETSDEAADEVETPVVAEIPEQVEEVEIQIDLPGVQFINQNEQQVIQLPNGATLVLPAAYAGGGNNPLNLVLGSDGVSIGRSAPVIEEQGEDDEQAEEVDGDSNAEEQPSDENSDDQVDATAESDESHEQSGVIRQNRSNRTGNGNQAQASNFVAALIKNGTGEDAPKLKIRRSRR